MKSGPHLFPHNILYGQSGFQIFWERHAMRYDRRFQRYHRLITLQRMADFWMDINQWTAEKIYSALIGIHEGIIPPLTIFWSCSVAMAGLCSTHGTFCVCKISKKWIDWVPFVQSNSSTWQQWLLVLSALDSLSLTEISASYSQFYLLKFQVGCEKSNMALVWINFSDVYCIFIHINHLGIANKYLPRRNQNNNKETAGWPTFNFRLEPVVKCGWQCVRCDKINNILSTSFSCNGMSIVSYTLNSFRSWSVYL